MAVIRCQSCGKPNPEFVETCQYCDARLRPLTAPLTPPAPPAAHTIQCQSCGKFNPDTLDQCQFCDARLKPMTGELPPLPGAASNVGLVKCQSCGKPNPDTLDTCQYCDARLKPATDELKAANARPAATEWLVAARGPAPAEDVPDWLRSTQATTAPLSTPAPTPAPAAAADVPDWMQAAETPATETPAAAPAEDVPDWLRSLRSASPTPEPERETPPPAIEPITDEAMPDWLRAMQAPAAESAPAAALAADVPDWLSSLREATPVADAPTASEPELAATPAEDVPDWLRSLQPAVEEPPAAVSTDTPVSTGTGGSETRPDVPAAVPAEDVPAWLQAMQAPAAEELPAAEPAAAPDWMSTLREAAPAAEEPTSEEAEPVILHPEPETADEMPTWLQALPPAAPEAAPGATPDWMNLPGVGPVDFEAPLDSKAASAAPADAMPDWMRALAPTDAGASTQPELPPSEALPDWMTTAQPSALEATTGEEAEPAPLPADAPDWLQSLRSASPITALADEPAAPTPGEAAPDWLSALRSGPASAAPEAEMPAEPPAEGAGLEQAALPNWLAAMRPVETSGAQQIAEEADAYEERVGVLAGMRGVLRAEPTVAQPHKSTVQVHKLDVTDDQARQASALSALINEGVQTRAIPKARRSFAPVLERWAVVLVLLAAVLTPLFAPGAYGFFPLPSTIGQEALAAFNTIDTLPADKPALVVFDYDPAQNGELHPGALAVTSHLVRRGFTVVGVSTHVAGAALGDAVLAEVAASVSSTVSYTYGTNYMNLGYLAGGPVAVAQLATELRATANSDFHGTIKNADDLWRSPALSAIQSLDDFGVIVVIAASPDGARTWMEQAQPHAPTAKFLAVVSAGAEPLVRPYAAGAAPQLSGLVSGLVGATQYEAQAGTGRDASEEGRWNWDALGGGLFAAAGLLAVGNIIFGVTGFVRRRRR